MIEGAMFRAYIKQGINDLIYEAEENWENEQILKNILTELQSRSTNKAKKLKTQVENRLKEKGWYDGPSSSEKSSESRNNRTHDRYSDSSPLEDDLKQAYLKIEELAEKLKGTTSKSAEAQSRIKELERNFRRSQSEIDKKYEKVGLAPSCPIFLIRAARQAFRKNFHPDKLSGATENEKKASAKNFDEYETIFKLLEKLNGND